MTAIMIRPLQRQPWRLLPYACSRPVTPRLELWTAAKRVELRRIQEMVLSYAQTPEFIRMSNRCWRCFEGRTSAKASAVVLVTFMAKSITVNSGESESRFTSATATASAKRRSKADPTNVATEVQLKVGLHTDEVAVADTKASAYESARARATDVPLSEIRELPAACIPPMR